MTTTYLYHIEEASPADASLLTAIARESKQHWGYSDAWMALWEEDLTITAEMIHAHHCCVARKDDEIAGFTIISNTDGLFEIEHCFVKPAYIGKGCGTSLLKHMLSMPQYQHAPFQVLADPNAVAFYEKFSFKTIRQVPSKPEGRTLPLMERGISD